MENSTQELKVESVKAINNKEVTVTFNKEVDKTTAEDAANYVFSNVSGGQNFGAITSKLSADKKSVILTLTTAANQQTTADLTVKNVKDADGKAVAETKKSVQFFDTTVPAAEKVEVTGPKTLKVTFSEPLKPGNGAANPAITYKLNGGSYSVTPSALTDGGRTVTLTLGAVLPTGTHTLEVSGGEDFAGFAIPKTTLSFEYKADAVAPTAKVEKANETVVTLKFDKPVKVTDANTDVTVYHTVNNSAGYKGTLAIVGGTNGYSDTYTATFTTPIPAGTGKTLFLNTKADKFEDQWGNDVASTSFTFDVVADTKAPAVSKVEATGKDATAQKELTVTFDKEVAKADAENKANYVLKDAQGNVVKTADFADVDNNGKFGAGVTLAYNNAKKQVTATFTNVLKAADYKLEVANIKDTTFGQNKLDKQTVDFNVKDLIAPKVTTATLIGTAVYVNFDEAMDPAGLTDIANYQIADTGAFPTGTTVEIVNNKQVKINLPAAHGLTVNKAILVNGAFKDVAGNKIGGLSAATSNTVNFAAATTTFAITQTDNPVKLVAPNKFEIELDRELSAVDVDQFSITDGSGAANTGVAISSATYVNNNGKSTVTVTLNKNLVNSSVAATNIGTLVIGVAGLTDALGLKNTSTTYTTGTAGHFVDKLAPSITEVKTTGVKEITVTFSEAINTGDISNLTFNVAGNSVDSVNTGTAGKAIITLTDAIATDAKPAVTQTLDIRDVAGNVLKGGTAVPATKDGVAPAVIKQLPAAATITAAATHTLEFSEALNDASKTAIKAAVTTAYAKGGTAAVDIAWNEAGTILTVKITGVDAGGTNKVTYSAVANTKATDLAGNESVAALVLTTP